MTEVGTVLISGAGIAGSTLAHWLHQHGIRATVVEKAPALRSGGYAIDLRGVAIDVVERMGLLDEVRSSVTEMSAGTFVDFRGRARAGFDSSMVASTERSLEILRGDLVHLVHGATTEHTEYLYDDSITGIEREDGGVRVTFRRTEPRVFGLVVGADGLHSTTRTLAFGPEEPYRRFLHSYVSIFTVSNFLGLEREAHLFNTPGRLAVLFHTPRAEGARALLLHRSTEETGIDRQTSEEQKRYLRETFAGHGWETGRLLDEMEHTPDFYFDSVTQIRMNRWSRERVTLLGDAGYCPSPMSGQGTSLAVVGAYVLAQELARHEVLATALEAYEARMRPYVHANQAIADPGLGFIAPRTRLGITVRNTFLKLGPLLSTLSRFDTKLSTAAEAFDLDASSPTGRVKNSS
jgi:2-polyprenyl-6-methoxyphenol hydroxylase-like FAD-dependent oxidoreductase